MKKIKKISYPEKYNELILKNGEEIGNELYYKFLRSVSLEKYILKYGEVDGNKKYNDWKLKMKNSGVSLEKLILKYGEIDGKERYKNWKLNTRQDLKGFIRRYGEKEGKIRYDEFKRKSNIPLSKLDRKKIPNPRKLDYWINKTDGDIEKSKKLLSEYQNTSDLNKFIKKYGEEKGKKKYIDVCKSKTNNLETYIIKYGEVDGKEKYNNYILNLKKIHSKDYIIKKYGELYYKELIIKKTTNFKNSLYSNIGFEFCDSINEKLKNNFTKIYYGDNEYKFYIWQDEFKIISVDLYIKDINLVIEFYGDFWHRNPKIYEKKNDDFKESIWKHDELRIKILKEKYNCNVIIVWENDYIMNKEKTIDNVIKKIINIKNE